MRTPEEWLALDDDELGLELAKVFTPGPWKHRWHRKPRGFRKCTKCEMRHRDWKDELCPVLDPITIDWNTAMEWRDKVMAGKDSTIFANNLLAVFGGGVEGDIDECFAFAEPKHYLIAVLSLYIKENPNETMRELHDKYYLHLL